MNNNGSRLTHGRTSVYNLNYHLIWCTKYRNKVLKGQVEQDLKDILYQIANENGYSSDHMEVGLDDHIHLLVSAPPKISVSSIAKQLKGTSLLRLFNMHPHLAERYWKPKTKRSIWSPSYYVESIGAVNEQAVAKYIDDQQLLMGQDIVSHTNLKPADLQTPLSARYVQEVYTQAHASFTSYLGWLTRKVRGLITGSSLDDDTKTLFYRLNAQQKWYKKTVELDWDVTPDGERLVPFGKTPQMGNMRISKAVDSKDLWLLRRMIKKAKQWLNLPNLSRVTSINLSTQTMELQPSGNSFAFWLNLATLEKGKRVLLPMTRNSYLEQELKKGKLNKQVQVKFKEDGTIAVSPIIEQETAELRTEGEALGLDWGMVNLFTTSDGRRLGGKMLQKLRIYDKLLMEIQAELQRNNESLKRNPEYQRLQSKIRNFVKNEIGRILNNLAKEDLKELVVEKLNFAGGGMSRTMNRLLTRVGRKALQAKLARLNEEQGVTTTEVQSAYTSQMCASCGYTDRKNRQSQAKFKCQCCGHTCNADVNAALNILQRRSLKISLSNCSNKRKTLKDRLLDAHSKICPSGTHLSMVSL